MLCNTIQHSYKFDMDPKFRKLDKFDGCKYTDWADKMTFLLNSLDVFYVLDPNLTPIPENPVSERGNEDVIFELEKQREARKRDEALCYKYIKNSLNDRLCELYASRATHPRLLWDALETNFIPKEEHVNSRHLVSKYLEFQMVEEKSVFDQVRDLHYLVYKLGNQSIFLPPELQIGAVLTKLPPSWKEFSETMMNKSNNFAFNFLMNTIDNKAMGLQPPPRFDGRIPRLTPPPKLNLGVKRNKFKKKAPRNLNVPDDELANMVSQLNFHE